MALTPRILRYYFTLLLMLAGSIYSFAQDVVFSAAASARKIGIQDQVQVQYVIKNVSDLETLGPKPEISRDFHVVGGPYSSQSSSFSVGTNGTTRSTSITITYVLQAKKTGKLTIPEATAKDASGQTYQSNSVPIEVVNGTLAQQQPRQQQRQDPYEDPFDAIMRQRQRQMQAMQQQRQQQRQEPQAASTDINKDLFIKVVVDKNKVHVGEQITATYKLYARLPMNVNISKLPSLNGFWTQDFDMPKGKITPTEEVINGQKFQVFTLKKSALFPQQTGTLELDPAEAEGMARVIQKTQQRDIFDDPFFNSFFMDDPFADEFFGRMAYQDVKVKLKSTPVKIQVTPLPETDQPEGFGGAVGNFTIQSSIDKTELTTDDVVNLKVTINGSGNIKLIEPPALKLPNGLVAYDPQVIDTITGRSNTISGSKIITYTITPRTAGDYEIPSIAFSYFNPQTGKYATLNTQPVKLHVKQGKTNPADVQKTIALTDIHPIDSTGLNNLSFNSKPFVFSTGYWTLFALPLFAFIGIVAWKRREDELSKDTTLLRNKRANKVALKRLATAQQLLQKNQRTPFYEEISKAIWLYLSDKLNIPLSSLSKENAWDALHRRNISNEMQQRVQRVMEDCETALYSGTGGTQQMNNTYTDAVEVISKLEESFKG